MNSALLKTMGIDVHKQTIKALKDAGKNFAQEFGVHPHEIQIRIMYDTEGMPYYLVFKMEEHEHGKKVWVKAREASLDEII
jgi:hypothetical protein